MKDLSLWRASAGTEREDAFTVSLNVSVSVSAVRLRLKKSSFGSVSSGGTSAAMRASALLISTTGLPNTSLTPPSVMDRNVLFTVVPNR